MLHDEHGHEVRHLPGDEVEWNRWDVRVLEGHHMEIRPPRQHALALAQIVSETGPISHRGVHIA